MARELSEMVKRMPKLDWTQRESVRADLRRSVRRRGDGACVGGRAGPALHAGFQRDLGMMEAGCGELLLADTASLARWRVGGTIWI